MMMKKLKIFSVWLALAVLALGCGEEGGLKGTLKISITDAPIDADNIKAVNIIITNVEGFQNDNWKAFKNFEQPVGVNLLAYTGGKSVLLIDQFTSPGEFSAMRLGLNMANRNSSFIVSPQSNVVFQDGTSSPLYMVEGSASEVVLDKSLGISSRGLTDITLDFDLRKSIRINDNGEFILDPFVRVVKTNNAGQINATLMNPIPQRLVVYAYPKGSYTTAEMQETSERPSFYNATTSAAIKTKNFSIGFLESGSYDLIVVKHDVSGKAFEVLGKQTDIVVNAREQTLIEIDLGLLNPS